MKETEIHGIIKLKQSQIIFDFKYISKLNNNGFISIIDMYDSIIDIPINNILYIMKFKDNIRKEGCEK